MTVCSQKESGFHLPVSQDGCSDGWRGRVDDWIHFRILQHPEVNARKNDSKFCFTHNRCYHSAQEWCRPTGIPGHPLAIYVEQCGHFFVLPRHRIGEHCFHILCLDLPGLINSPKCRLSGATRLSRHISKPRVFSSCHPSSEVERREPPFSRRGGRQRKTVVVNNHEHMGGIFELPLPFGVHKVHALSLLLQHVAFKL